ncbi:UDP-glucose 4-epimerase GalE [Cryomorphaceae bacterium 1068]|nr:UDP-glucose 4-epimerase GalE [Cryomorphaceae bacterium 1068]
MIGKIIVTGGAGFIGSHICAELLSKGFKPVVIDDLRSSSKKNIQVLLNQFGDNISFYECSCQNRGALEAMMAIEKHIDGIIHLAALKSIPESQLEPTRYYENNLGSLNSIIDFAMDYGIERFIFSSSCAVYGSSINGEVNENTVCTDLLNPYALTKSIGETILRLAAKSGRRLSAISLRYFNPIGCHPMVMIGEEISAQSLNLVPMMLKTALGNNTQLEVFGYDLNTPDGSCVRDFIHVCDVASAHVHALHHSTVSGYETYNIGTGRGTSVFEMIQKFESITGKSLPLRKTKARELEILEIYANVNKASTVLDWEAQYSVDEALKHVWTRETGGVKA